MLGLFVVSGCGSDADKESTENTNETIQAQLDEVKKAPHPIVTMKIKDFGTLELELYNDIAPITVINFVNLIQEKYYDGLNFHRISPGFVVQGGDPDGNGTGGPGYVIKGEFDQNGVENTLKHTKGVISMARTSESFDSAGSQFFFMLEDAPHLDGGYAAFGKITSGIDILETISTIPPTSDMDVSPLTPLVIEKVTVDTKGFTYPAVIKAN